MPARRRKAEVETNSEQEDDSDRNHDPKKNGVSTTPPPTLEATAEPLSKTEEEWAVRGPTTIVKNLAMYRFILFWIIVYDYATYLPHQAWPGPDQSMSTWFTYDQFEFIYHWTPKMGDPFWGEDACTMLYWLGIAAGISAACGGIPTVAYSFEMSGLVILLLYAFRFLTFVQFFTNHNYLFMLLGFLVVISGGGSYFPPRKKAAVSRMIQKSEWGAIMIRIQYAVVYFYASLWKMTPNWLDGSICKMIFTTFQEQGVNRGVPWKELYEEYGNVLFQFVALGGIILDSGMFCALTLRRPDPKTTKWFSRLSVMFHGFVCFTMSQRIGYTFPSCCLAGSLIFYPIGNDPRDADIYAQSKKNDDAEDNNAQPNESKNTLATSLPSEEGNLPQWVWRYATGAKSSRATRGQRLFALSWTFVQIGMPLRMPIISQNTFPFTSRCYRWSWTMMLHARSSLMVHSGKHLDGPMKGQMYYVPLDLMFLYPECADSVPIQRKFYKPDSLYRHADPRTIPLVVEAKGIVQARQRALMDQFPRHVARVAGGWSEQIYKHFPWACRNVETNETRRIAVYGVYFTRLDGKGAYCRVFDPTVDLTEAEQARKRRTAWETFVGVVLDKAPYGHEYLLMKGIGSMNGKVAEHKKTLAESYPQVKTIEFIADRAACLAARPLTLWPAGFRLAVMVLELPLNASIQLSHRNLPDGSVPDRQWENMSKPEVTTLNFRQLAVTSNAMIEFSAIATGKCAETSQEDVLIALLFPE